MKPATFKSMVLMTLDDILEQIGGTNNVFYLKDGDDNFHKIIGVDLFSNKLKCEDDYFDYIDYIIDAEGVDDKLFIKCGFQGENV